MSDAGEEEQSSSSAPVKEVTFNVKSSSDSKFVVTVPESITVLELKEKLAGEQYANVEAARQRLIYSGRVLKDADTLATYKVKDGNTVHLVKGAASNARPSNPAASSSSPAGAAAAAAAAGVPTNLSTGTGTDPLAGLTGARYAGFAQLPGAEHFGADGGMGAPQTPDDLLRQMENPMFASQMNEAMNNPHIIRMMQNSPQVRDNPMLRQMLENPETRRMLMNPDLIRRSIAMHRGMMGGGGAQPTMPGVTDTTPQTTAGPGNNNGSTGEGPRANAGQPSPFANPFAMFGAPGAGGAGGAQGNPFAALFGGGAGDFGGGAGAASPFGGAGGAAATGATNPDGTPATPSAPGGQDGAAGQQAGNPFAAMAANPRMAAMAQEMMQNPEMMRMAMHPDMMRMAMQSLGMGGAPGQGQGQGSGGDAGGAGADGDAAAAAASNPFAALFGGGAGAGGAGGMDPFAMFGGGGAGGFGGQPSAPADTRPPEEQYAEQLRQLNEMGFYEFERNVTALRRAGGNVQGAVNLLFEGGI